MKIPVKIYQGDNTFEHRLDESCHPDWDYYCMVSPSFVRKYKRIMDEYNNLMIELKKLREEEKEPNE